MYKVLLVDDEILVRQAISAKIQWNSLGFELTAHCENGRQAIEFLEKNPVDVVLTDIYMPHVDGMELSRYLYENFPQVQIIIFSGYGDFEYAKQALQYKVSEYILKPVTAKELSEVLGRTREKLDGLRRQEEKLDELTKVYRNYARNEAVIVSKALSRLVSGTQEMERSLQELKDLGVEIHGNAFRVVAADIDVYSELYETDKELKKESALMSFAVENISAEIVKSLDAGLAYRDSDNRVCLLLWGKMHYGESVDAKALCREIQENVYQAMKLSVSMGIGCVVHSLEELSRSYESAAYILQYRYTKGIGVIFDCEEDKGEENPMELRQEQKEFAIAVNTGNKEEVQEQLDRMEVWMRARYISRNAAVSYLHQILQTVYENVSKAEEEFAVPDAAVSAVTRARSLEKAMETVREYALEGVSAVVQAGRSSGERQAMRAMHYIQENYGNPDLGLNQICEYLNMSTSRFSSIFKEATGRTFIEELLAVRMEKAKQLLRQTRLKNYEIAEKVGFSDPHYFSVAFKKATGRTPKEYAREHA